MPKIKLIIVIFLSKAPSSLLYLFTRRQTDVAKFYPVSKIIFLCELSYEQIALNSSSVCEGFSKMQYAVAEKNL
jgi:hypothetical protein